MERLDHANQVAVLHLQQAGTTMGQSHKYIITIQAAIKCTQIQGLGKPETNKQFYLKIFFCSTNRRCYFYGQISAVTSMWQTVNLTGLIDPLLIDNQTVWFNFSAWIGGYANQDDNAQASLTFLNQTNQKVGNTITLGPILAAARGSITSLLFQQADGLVYGNGHNYSCNREL
jgi:hypothetical protein